MNYKISFWISTYAILLVNLSISYYKFLFPEISKINNLIIQLFIIYKRFSSKFYILSNIFPISF